MTKDRQYEGAKQKAEQLQGRAVWQPNQRHMPDVDAVRVDANNSAYKTKSRQENVLVRLADGLRSRLNRAFKKGYKSGSAVDDLGCSIPEFKKHLESKFEDGMDWESYGIGSEKWTIDHIIPLCRFDLTSRQHVVLACHYLNLQPMWFEENSSKGGR